MKNIVFIVVFLLSFISANAQKTYTVLNENYELKTEVTGTIELLWNIIDDNYRYFAKKGEAIVELTNTRGPDNKYQEEYKTILKGITSEANIPVDKVNLTLPSLRDFIFDYNAAVDPNYSEKTKKSEVQAKLLFFGGITNSPFITNPDNISNPVFGAEIEVYEGNNLPRHSIFLQAKHVTSNDKFQYSNTQFGLGYRFRFINLEGFNLFANIVMATYSFTKTEIVIQDQVFNDSSNAFDAPFIFGVGADIKISDGSYITLSYDELFAIALENAGNFSTHFTLGYKLNL
jgi:hypothetical protein